MKIKFIQAAIVGLVLMVSSLASATIINNGDYTTVGELNWLDFTATTGLTETEALAANFGWRMATLDEVKSMMNKMFEINSDFQQGFVDCSEFNPNGRFDVDEERMSRFLEYFGITSPRYCGIVNLAT